MSSTWSTPQVAWPATTRAEAEQEPDGDHVTLSGLVDRLS
jgi:hypothetical protein